MTPEDFQAVLAEISELEREKGDGDKRRKTKENE